jgi:hypothetical protein
MIETDAPRRRLRCDVCPDEVFTVKTISGRGGRASAAPALGATE